MPNSEYSDEFTETEDDEYEPIQVTSWGSAAPSNWDSLVDTSIKLKPGGVGTGNLHRKGSNYAPISEAEVLSRRLRNPPPGQGKNNNKNKKRGKKVKVPMTSVRTEPIISTRTNGSGWGNVAQLTCTPFWLDKSQLTPPNLPASTKHNWRKHRAINLHHKEQQQQLNIPRDTNNDHDTSSTTDTDVWEFSSSALSESKPISQPTAPASFKEAWCANDDKSSSVTVDKTKWNIHAQEFTMDKKKLNIHAQEFTLHKPTSHNNAINHAPSTSSNLVQRQPMRANISATPSLDTNHSIDPLKVNHHSKKTVEKDTTKQVAEKELTLFDKPVWFNITIQLAAGINIKLCVYEDSEPTDIVNTFMKYHHITANDTARKGIIKTLEKLIKVRKETIQQ
ncbi:hypothetical protein G6F70_004570 [Rhizopus microsporus]|nr:hypothetical protein G6F71_008044 [Rhizopus microsporus]KAG1199827.1 hypothetical protein G6F70_004570 [Rhizopus microsporus]KAG1212114.1 hypothetical protein G6F69_004001 [Rhizopus microsporus]KAG1234065.1 hypothetical protein G6F67_003822 [Rhizopus microsporus]KAG1265431.1 hypothetical protein G6F68_003576 [Rhizopus microsporus]